jgi:hypothetical protein
MIMLLKVSFSNLQLILSRLMLEELNKQFLVILIVGDLFSNAKSQKQGNIKSVKC